MDNPSFFRDLNTKNMPEQEYFFMRMDIPALSKAWLLLLELQGQRCGHLGTKTIGKAIVYKQEE